MKVVLPGLLLAVFVVMAGAAVAQKRADPNICLIEESGRTIHLEVRRGATGNTLRVVTRGKDGREQACEVRTSLESVGAWAHGGRHGEIFLADSERVALIREGEWGAWSLARTSHFPRADIRDLALAWLMRGLHTTPSESRYTHIYLLDGRGRILYADHEPGGQGPFRWREVVEAGKLIESLRFRLKAYRLLTRSIAGGSETIVQVFRRKAHAAVPSVFFWHAHAEDAADRIKRPGINIGDRSLPSVLDDFLAPGQTEVRVAGLSGDTLRLLRADWPGASPVASVTLGGEAGSASEGVLRTPPLQWGAYYEVRSSRTDIRTGPSTPEFRIPCRDRSLEGRRFKAGWVDTVGLCQDGVYITWIEAVGPGKINVSYRAVLAVAMYDPGNPPIDRTGPVPVLLPLVAVDRKLSIRHAEQSRCSVVLEPMHMPDPDLAHVVLLFQWFVFMKNRVQVSDIHGVMIQEQDYQAAARCWKERRESAPPVAVRPASGAKNRAAVEARLLGVKGAHLMNEKARRAFLDEVKSLQKISPKPAPKNGN